MTDEIETPKEKIKPHRKLIPYDEAKIRKNRRKMAWVALISIMVVTYLAFFHVSIERLKVLGEVITWFYFVMGSIVGAYLGFSTAFDMKNKKKDDLE